MPVTELLLICAGVAYVSTEALKRSLKLKGKKNIQRLVSTIIGVATAWFICDGENEPTKKQLLIGFIGGSGATFLIMLLKGHLGSKNKLLKISEKNENICYDSETLLSTINKLSKLKDKKMINNQLMNSYFIKLNKKDLTNFYK